MTALPRPEVLFKRMFRHLEALAFYERAGYTRRSRFGDDRPDPLWVLMEKTETR